MTKKQASQIADQLISLGVRLEAIVGKLPTELRDTGSIKAELNFLIRRVERAAS